VVVEHDDLVDSLVMAYGMTETPTLTLKAADLWEDTAGEPAFTCGRGGF
jgi:hypothetical protein